MNAIVIHLWSSTLVLLVAMIAARLLPLTARTRYAILLCGLLKFAFPEVAITAPLRAIGIDLANLGAQPAGRISIQWLGGPATLRTLAPQTASPWPSALMIAWTISAAALAMAWAIARVRLVTSALNASKAASSREQSALAAARLRLGLRASVDVMRSTICEAPAVVRIIRPVVVLPDGGCDALDDDELESLLRHECAHVARRDNLAGFIESAVVAVFWFHPLIWIAQRSIGTAREEACDEIAAANANAIDTYVSALSKICRAVLTPRLAGVSCMASGQLKERMNHIMNFEQLRHRALSHRFVVTFAALLFVAVTAGSGVHAASSSDPKNTPYTLMFSVRPGEAAGSLEFSGRVSDTATGLLLVRPGVTFKKGSGASIHTVAEGRDVGIDVRDLGSKVSAVMRVSQDGVQQQESTYFTVPQSEATAPHNAAGRRYTGAPISMNLKDADIQDVLHTFAKLTSTEIKYPPSLHAKVTIDVNEMPWDEAFDLVLRQNNLTWEMSGDVITIKQ